jgi:hypothetical protein
MHNIELTHRKMRALPVALAGDGGEGGRGERGAGGAGGAEHGLDYLNL